MKKSTKYGIIGSVISCILVLLLLFLIVFPGLKTPPKEDEGIIVSFGEKLDGSGMTEIPTSKPVMTEKPTKTTQPVNQELITQNDKSLAIAEQKQKKKQQDFIESQRIENEKKLANEKRKEQEAIDNAKVMNGMFGNNNSVGKGTGSGKSEQGNPVGKGLSGGNSWFLDGRLLTGQLVSPKYNRDVEGKVTVNIKVDGNGNVISVSIGSPTTISDAETRNAAIAAANNTHFSSGKGISAGTITYNFKLK